MILGGLKTLAINVIKILARNKLCRPKILGMGIMSSSSLFVVFSAVGIARKVNFQHKFLKHVACCSLIMYGDDYVAQIYIIKTAEAILRTVKLTGVSRKQSKP